MFVTFEGPEGSGKTTAIAGVKTALEARGSAVLVTREPGAGTVGSSIRSILLDGEDLVPSCELFLFLADRAQHVEAIIRPALSEGKIVLCDRYADSTIVYQGYGRGLGLELLRMFNQVATGNLTPDLTLLFDLDPEIGLARRQHLDRLDRESLAFHQAVRSGFLIEAQRDMQRWSLIDGSQSVEQVQKDALSAILERI